MLKVFFLLLLINLASAQRMLFEDDFSYIKYKYQAYFYSSPPRKHIFEITKNDIIGTYVCNKLKYKFNNREIIVSDGCLNAVASYCTGMTIFGSQYLAEIRLSEKFHKQSCDINEFWKTLILELENANHALHFCKNEIDYEKEKISKITYVKNKINIEYHSVIAAQKFQREIWDQYFIKKNIEPHILNWFIPTSEYSDWISFLKNSDDGKKYLHYLNASP